MLRDYQAEAVKFALNFYASAAPGSKLLIASPTGTGKSYMELSLQSHVADSLIITPKIEIISALLSKRGFDTSEMTEMQVQILADLQNIYTPIRFRNRLLAGLVTSPPLLIVDETHHDMAESWRDIHLLCGNPPAVGFTATPFRGTPESTRAFRDVWGSPVWALDLPDAVESGVLSFPECDIAPLVDDDKIAVRNGELTASEVSSAVMSRIEDAAKLADGFNTPTMFAVPSIEALGSLEAALRFRGTRSVIVTGKTPYNERQRAFQACIDREAVLLQVSVVSEGVDLPIRCLVDLAPTLSPVKWLQQFGRITRPGGRSRYICTNRNLLRHGYLLEGCLPITAMVKAQTAFPPSSRSAGIRALGLEAIGRLSAVEVPLRSGLKALMYAMSAKIGNSRVDYCVVVHPLREDVLWAEKRSHKSGTTSELVWGRWTRCEPPAELTGFASLPQSPLTPKQAAWWTRCAGARGLDPAATITQKQFAILPVLFDIRERL